MRRSGTREYAHLDESVTLSTRRRQGKAECLGRAIRLTCVEAYNGEKGLVRVEGEGTCEVAWARNILQ
jgi:hypothetical protein